MPVWLGLTLLGLLLVGLFWGIWRGLGREPDASKNSSDESISKNDPGGF